MACNSIKSFTYEACEANLGGVKNIWLANYVEGCATLTEDTEAPAVASFAENIEWIHYPMRKNVASMTSTLNTSADGAVYVSTEVSMVFSKMDTQKRVAIMALALGECMAIVEDSNGKKWFLGYDAPLTATAGTGETGTAKGDRNAYAVTLTDESAEMPYEVTGNITLAK